MDAVAAPVLVGWRGYRGGKRGLMVEGIGIVLLRYSIVLLARFDCANSRSPANRTIALLGYLVDDAHHRWSNGSRTVIVAGIRYLKDRRGLGPF